MEEKSVIYDQSFNDQHSKMPLGLLNHLTKLKAAQHFLPFLFLPPLPLAKRWW